MSPFTPEACPRWQKCSANICPLDPEWRDRKHLKGEPVCGLALEAVKPGADARLAGYVRQEVVAEVSRVLPNIMSRWYVIRKVVERAATNGSRLDRLPRRAEKESAANLGGRAAEGSDNYKSRAEDNAFGARGANA
jgi:hypothetical protein